MDKDLIVMTDEEFEAWLEEVSEGITIPAPSLSQIEGDEDDPWDY